MVAIDPPLFKVNVPLIVVVVLGVSVPDVVTSLNATVPVILPVPAKLTLVPDPAVNVPLLVKLPPAVMVSISVPPIMNDPPLLMVMLLATPSAPVLKSG